LSRQNQRSRLGYVVPRLGGKGIALICGNLRLVTKVRDCASATLAGEIGCHGFDKIGVIHSTITYTDTFRPIKVSPLIVVERASISVTTAAIAGEVRGV
jgi:hypothetical protein